MPIYEYRCKRCDQPFETWVATSGQAVACPACASPEVMRKLSVFGLKTADRGAPATLSAGGGCCGGGCACH